MLLSSVSCSSWRCVAVGQAEQSADHVMTLAEAWNGVRWRLLPTPSQQPFSTLQSISCANLTICTAVGAAGRLWAYPMSEVFDNGTWHEVRTARIGPPALVLADLTGASCPSMSGCISVGSISSEPLLGESWNGARWGSCIHQGQKLQGDSSMSHACP